MLDFVFPYAFLLLPVWLWFCFRYQPKLSKGIVLKVPFIIQAESKSSSHIPSWIQKFCIFLGGALFISALANPQWIGDKVTIKHAGRDIMLAVDISGSMETSDFVYNQYYLTRLDAVKIVVNDFIEKRKEDKFGLVLFADEAYLHVPLTFDKQTLKTLLSETFVGMAGEKTAIGDAMGLSIKKLVEQPLKEKNANAKEKEDNKAFAIDKSNSEKSLRNQILILLTDGENNAGVISPKKAAELAVGRGLKIYTIGISGQASSLIRNPNQVRNAYNYHPDIDERLLTEIAQMTGGKYYRATDMNDFQQIYDEIDGLEATDSEQVSHRPHKSLFYIPLLLSLAVFGLTFLCSFIFGFSFYAFYERFAR